MKTLIDIPILIERIGGDIGQGIAKCLREYSSTLKLIGTDSNSDCGWEVFTDEFILEGQENIIYKDKFFWRFPYAQKRGLTSICDDKLKLYLFLLKENIPTPKTFSSKEILIKLREGHGGKGLKNIDDKEMIQERVEGIEITCPIYITQTGEIRILQLKRTLIGNMTKWAKVVKYENIDYICTKLALLLGFKGAFNIQLILTKEGPKVHDINPRFSSTVYMRHLLGFTDVVWQLEEMNGYILEPWIYPLIGQEVIRMQGAKLCQS